MTSGLPPAAATGRLGVAHLERLWSRTLRRRAGRASDVDVDEWQHDRIVMHALGVGLEPALQFLMHHAPSLDEFERWIVETAGDIDAAVVERINAAVNGMPVPAAARRMLDAVDAHPDVLSDNDLQLWEEQGYVVVREAVAEDARRDAERAIWKHLGIDPDDRESWYRPRSKAIMLDLYHHPAFVATRSSLRVHRAFAQLWGTSDLWMSTDRGGFHAPQRPDWPFPGPDLHWDVSLAQPIPMGTQGILYLTDTPAEQGALTLVPGFHRRVGDWLASLPPGARVRDENLHALGSMPVPGRAGDLVIWHQALPHGSRPNIGERPRIVQYIEMFPTHVERRSEWI